jgi:hypothetical protein
MSFRNKSRRLRNREARRSPSASAFRDREAAQRTLPPSRALGAVFDHLRHDRVLARRSPNGSASMPFSSSDRRSMNRGIGSRER